MKPRPLEPRTVICPDCRAVITWMSQVEAPVEHVWLSCSCGVRVAIRREDDAVTVTGERLYQNVE